MQFSKPPFDERGYNLALQLGRRLAFCVDEEHPHGTIEQSALLEEVKDLVRTHRAFCYDTTRHQCVLAEAVAACFLGLRDGMNDATRLKQDVLLLPLVTPPTASGVSVSAGMRFVSAEALVNVAPHPQEALADISREHELWRDDQDVRSYDTKVLARWEKRARQRQLTMETGERNETLAFTFSSPRQMPGL